MTNAVFTPIALPESLIPQRLPQGWRLFKPLCHPSQAAWKGPKALAVMVSVGIEADGRRWLHASMSAPRRLPTYEELKLLKRVWIGPGLTAYQVFAPDAKHVNIHPNCLHLWACLDGPVTPDFTRGIGVI